jgi:hypothetical protein
MGAIRCPQGSTADDRYSRSRHGSHLIAKGPRRALFLQTAFYTSWPILGLFLYNALAISLIRLT